MKNLVIGFLFGAAAMAVAVVVLQGEKPGNRSARTDAPADASPATVSPRQSPRDFEEPPMATSTAAEPNVPGTQPRAAGTDVAATPPRALQDIEIPGGMLDASVAGRAPLKQLLEAFRIDCQYGPGFGGGWPKGELSPHTAAWQGGPITFDTIDLETGTARLKNSSGFTRTLDGELEVRVHPTDTGLHFTVFAPRGELIVASVYGVLDAQRRNLAVVSFHGPHLDHESAQFYGACTLA